MPAIGLAILVALSFIPSAIAHSGGLDKQGGHRNGKTGQYHRHRPASTTVRRTASPAAQSYRETLVGEYFRAANQGALYWDGAKCKRDVSGSQRKRVLRRDGYRCVVCGSTQDLEVDHRRALQNGGDNRLSNLATLCHECHVIKTKMDGSLRRKRERNQR